MHYKNDVNRVSFRINDSYIDFRCFGYSNVTLAESRNSMLK